MFGVWVAGRKDRQTPEEIGGQFRSDQWAGRRKLSLKDFLLFARQYCLHGSGHQVGQAWNGQRMVDYNKADQYRCTAPCCQSFCAVAEIIGKPESLDTLEE